MMSQLPYIFFSFIPTKNQFFLLFPAVSSANNVLLINLRIFFLIGCEYWMQKNIRSVHVHHNTEELCNEHHEQINGITQMIVDAVEEYNMMLLVCGNFKCSDANELLMREAEEDSAKMFLDGVLDFIQRRNTESDFFLKYLPQN